MNSEFEPSPSKWIRRLPDPLPPNPEELGHVEVRIMGRFPSYRYKLEEARRVRKMVGEVLDIYDPLRDINDKRIGYVFADHHGIDHPLVYGDYESFGQIAWEALPDAFVLKSRFGSSNRGVKALIKQGEGSYFDLLRGRIWTVPEMAAAQAELEQTRKASRSMFAEELIVKDTPDPQVADDWKFYCFDGRVALSMQRDLRGSPEHRDWRFAFRDREWNNLGSVKFVDRIDLDLPLPRDPDALIRVAEYLSKVIGHPFLRIDLLESPRGPLLGEFTPLPGPPEVFTAEIDSMLGAFWEQADARVYARSITSGAWDHLAFGRTEETLYPSLQTQVPDTTLDSEKGIDDLIRELTAIRSALAEARRQVTGQLQRMRELEADLDRLSNANAKLSGLLEQRTLQVSDLSAQLKERTRDVSELSARLQRRTHELSELIAVKNRLDQVQRRVSRLESDRATLRLRVEVLKWKLESMRQRRWWRLGQLLGAARTHPSNLIRLPQDVVNLIRQPAERRQRPGR